MNENHDAQNGQFTEGGSGGKGGGVKGRLKDAHARLDALRNRVHSSKTYHALAVKDRFTKMVPPGSKRDRLVKHAATFAEAGLLKGGAVAVGGPAAGAAAATYSWGKYASQGYAKFKGGFQGLGHLS